jgi:hypothetical protein
MNTHILPTPDEIDAVIFDIIAAEAAQVPDDTSLDELWTSAVAMGAFLRRSSILQNLSQKLRKTHECGFRRLLFLLASLGRRNNFGRQSAMALIHGLGEGKGDAGAHPDGGILLNAEFQPIS